MILTQFESNKLETQTNPKNYPFVDEFLKFLDDKVINIDGQILSIAELTLLVDSADHIICIDSFLHHLAWLRNCRAIVLWGLSDPLIFGHDMHLNILKDRKHLRVQQYDIWEKTNYNQTAYNPEIFYSGKELWENIKEEFNN